ncbi:hypothetical protein ALC53_11036 [Atta colombica]|uniref:Uncharacterized protein n=1 Tax=Atta colombica TaxID=520822 RepID=A0A195B1N4_9HYME|nr:hypothetical protein ALC53_11036 [Atta colombica]
MTILTTITVRDALLIHDASALSSSPIARTDRRRYGWYRPRFWCRRCRLRYRDVFLRHRFTSIRSILIPLCTFPNSPPVPFISSRPSADRARRDARFPASTVPIIERRSKKLAVFLVSPVILVRMVGKRVFRGRDTLITSSLV